MPTRTVPPAPGPTWRPSRPRRSLQAGSESPGGTLETPRLRQPRPGQMRQVREIEVAKSVVVADLAHLLHAFADGLRSRPARHQRRGVERHLSIAEPRLPTPALCPARRVRRGQPKPPARPRLGCRPRFRGRSPCEHRPRWVPGASRPTCLGTVQTGPDRRLPPPAARQSRWRQSQRCSRPAGFVQRRTPTMPSRAPWATGRWRYPSASPSWLWCFPRSSPEATRYPAARGCCRCRPGKAAPVAACSADAVQRRPPSLAYLRA